MRGKIFTKDCPKCDLLKVDDDHQMICNWGKGNKIMTESKGKKPLFCKLKR